MTKLEFIIKKIEETLAKVISKIPAEWNEFNSKLVQIEIDNPYDIRQFTLRYLKGKKNQDNDMSLFWEYIEVLFKQCLTLNPSDEISDDYKQELTEYFKWVKTTEFYNEVCDNYQ